ncbi:MAG: helix-turn-helix domain-containing protein [Oleiphilaceae bacterium]|nr:helix-turn-helix domain-containing protein [Oleiphilaceae bacterium]
MKTRNAPKGASKHQNSTSAQRSRLLQALLTRSTKGVTTIYARETLDIMSPASRLLELRKLGFDIRTVRVTEENAQGHKHVNARYVLISCKQVNPDTLADMVV